MFTGFSPNLASLIVNTDIGLLTGPGFNSISPHTSNEHLADDMGTSKLAIHLFVGQTHFYGIL